ncbi:hypothetical protein MNBD_ALPHA06-55 [hydrothermal vent metagenome]|uniref:Uncharacterized protein n=1 Tax=hydrothermal vent metagenome TaxID=652676 RepID=A0A3B0RW41_9ZZZZ
MNIAMPLAISLLVLPGTAAADDFFKQLRREDGITGEQAAARKKPAKALPSLTVAAQPWKKPVWMQSRANPPGFSANRTTNAETAGFSQPATASRFRYKAVLGWDSEFVFRGLQLAKQNASGGIELAYGNAYAGAWATVPTVDAFGFYQNRFDIFAGYGFDISDAVFGDVGVTGYIRTDDGVFYAQEDSVEAYAGLSMGGAFKPSLYGFYDFMLERYTLEAAAEYSLPLGRTDLVLGGTGGYSNGDGVDYGYLQIDAEIVQNLNRNTSIGLGGHFAASTEATFLQGLALSGDTTTWFGVRLRTGN